jgi:hypothetical protein
MLIRPADTPDEDNTVGPRGVSKVDDWELYRHTFLRAHYTKEFCADDTSLNGIEHVNCGIPKFVREYEEKLGKKRKVATDVCCFRL